MYIYRHKNGTYHFKVDWAVDSIGSADYFDSPFVDEWKYFDSRKKAEEWIKNDKTKRA